MKLKSTQKSKLWPNLLTAVIFVALISCIACGSRSVVKTEVEEEEFEYEAGKILVQIASPYFDDLDAVLKSAGGVSDSTGITNLDNYLENYGMYEVYTSLYGLANGDIRIKVNDTVDIEALSSNLENLTEIEWAEPNWVMEYCTPTYGR